MTQRSGDAWFHVLLTWPQRVGIVASNSYIVIVNAGKVRQPARNTKLQKEDLQ